MLSRIFKQDHTSFCSIYSFTKKGNYTLTRKLCRTLVYENLSQGALLPNFYPLHINRVDHDC